MKLWRLPDSETELAPPLRRAWWQLRLVPWRIRHRLTGPQRGCSCSRCFYHPRRRVPAAEVYRDRIRLAEVERQLREHVRRHEQSREARGVS